MSRWKPSTLTLTLLTAGFAQARVNWIDQPVDHPPIPLLDRDGNHVLESGKPYSPRRSCAGSGCHDYDKITSAYHFQMGREETRDDWGAIHGNLPGVSHLVGPGWFGGFNCMGGSIPKMLASKRNPYKEFFRDYGAPGFIQNCSSCHAGGGFGEKDRNGNFYDQMAEGAIEPLDGDYYNRGTDENNRPTDKAVVARFNWEKSGLLEADCLMCHVDLRALRKPDPRMGQEGEDGMAKGPDGSDSAFTFWYRGTRNRLIQGYHFGWAATAILEFINLGTPERPIFAASFERQWKGDRGGKYGDYELALNGDGTPKLRWNPEAFDEQGRIHLKMLRFPESENCMNCHRTSNSRRGFYGFGEEARAEVDPEKGFTVVEDYRDDIHKGKDLGKYWGEKGRVIDSCNACHSREYYKSRFANVNLDADHNFPKGHSDMDVRNDLDFDPDLKSCETCHVEGQTPDGLPPVIPSGQKTLLEAHLVRWQHSGYLKGYAEESLKKIVQTHFDVVSCQTCHIPKKQGRHGELQLMYRYRKGMDGKYKIVTYNPRLRYLWIDKTTGWALPRYERNLVVVPRRDENGKMIKAGEAISHGRKRPLYWADIVDPETGEKLGEVEVRIAWGSVRIHDDSLTADAIRALKIAYDRLMAKRHQPLLKGRAPDVRMVWLESNEYILSHNTRPAVESLPCGACHEKKQSGAFSSLISERGVLGSGHRKDVFKLPDPKLVEEGIVELGMPYFKLDVDGTIYMTSKDILFATLVDDFMSVNQLGKSRFFGGTFQKLPTGEVAEKLGVPEEILAPLGEALYLAQAKHGDETLTEGGWLVTPSPLLDAVAPLIRIEALVYDRTQRLVDYVRQRTGLTITSDAIHLSLIDPNRRILPGLLGHKLLVKLPYKGRATDRSQITILYSRDGRKIERLPQKAIVAFQPAESQGGGFDLPGSGSLPARGSGTGYVLFLTDLPEAYYAVADL